MPDAAGFRLEIERFMTQVVPAKAAELQRKIVAETLTAIVLRTPVGNNTRWKSNLDRLAAWNRNTSPNKKPFVYLPKGYVGGQARRNWQVTFDVPARTVKQGVDASGQSALSEGYGVAARITGPSRVWISNPLQYMEPLENGWSKQAPEGIVRRAVADITAKYAGRPQ